MSRRIAKALLVACFACVVMNDVPAQTRAEAPQLTTSHEWFYRWIPRTEPPSTYRVHVANVDDQRLVMVSGKQTFTYDREWNLLEIAAGPQTRAFTDWPVLRFPLEVGKEWHAHSVIKSHDVLTQGTMSVHVEAQETVTVPAGTFETFRIRRSFRASNLNVNTHMHLSYAVEVFWYAPEVEWWAKGRLEYFGFETYDEHELELLKFKRVASKPAAEAARQTPE